MTRVTILVDNVAQPGLNLMPEHGFSALVQQGSERILFDTGQGPALKHNPCSLGVEMSTLSAVVLSHGHYDHTGGLLHVVETNPGIRVVAHPAIFSPHLKSAPSDPMLKSIGIPYTRETLESRQAAFHLVSDVHEISPGVWFTGTVPRVFPTMADERLKTLDRQCEIADPLEDDCSLVLDTASGPVLLLGCAHAGVRNILHHVRARLGIDRVHAVIGGTHLGLSAPNETFRAIEAFEEASVQVIAPTHCTGEGPKDLLRAHFGDRYCHAEAGTVMEF
jgi:7,8-dihydropterin-6-yl-methyl-4-(beta-D-ribofuranosyl)aminobenzene 5'-phosphate synthase